MILEMADESGKHSRNSGSREDDFFKEKFYFFKNFKLIKENIYPDRMKLYNFGSKYYLTDEHDNYLGHIEFTEETRNIIKISHSGSILKGGFYNIIFTNILAYTDIKEILSDDNLSTNAISSYDKLFHQKSLTVQILTNPDDLRNKLYNEFSKETLKYNSKFVVSVKNHHVREALRRIDENKNLRETPTKTNDFLYSRFLYNTIDENFGKRNLK